MVRQQPVDIVGGTDGKEVQVSSDRKYIGFHFGVKIFGVSVMTKHTFVGELYPIEYNLFGGRGHVFKNGGFQSILKNNLGPT